MFFRPKFCANCGDKIERADWGIFTSRRFCPVCETEFKGQDLIPRAIVAAGILVGALGVGGYLRSQPPQTPASTGEARRLAGDNGPNRIKREDPPSPSSAAQPKAQLQATPAEVSRQYSPQTQAPQPLQVRPTLPADPVYMCGAETRKGTPCSRRVKGPVRCFQHTGMPAMVSVDKLKLN